MTLQSKSFGSKCELPDKFISGAMKCGVVESVMEWVRFKQQVRILNSMALKRIDLLFSEILGRIE